ncbi:MAG: hypothetical protein HY841_07090 [Bacteroidetes bacterium]|nr:hypothetical protein [Bacteroidota bacterium]
MFDRNKFFRQYQIKFHHDLKKSLEGFSASEQIDITDSLLAIAKNHLKDSVDYDSVQKIVGELQKKFGKRLVNFYNVNPIEYFSAESLKHINLQYELKVKDAGSSDNFFTKEELEIFLKWAVSQFILQKEMLALQLEPEGSKEEISGTEKIKTKGKIKRERDDKATRLNQEQTALLIYCLRKTQVILKDEYLNNKETGQAFSILTGYSADTIRQNLNKSELARIATQKNITALLQTLTDIQKLIDKEIMPEE